MFVSCTTNKTNNKLSLQNVWTLTHINGQKLYINSESNRPQIEIKVDEKKVLGKGSCNRFFGNIDILTETELVFSDALGTTKMACPEMNIEDAFFKALTNSKTYTIEKNSLYLFDKNKEKVLKFMKID